MRTARLVLLLSVAGVVSACSTTSGTMAPPAASASAAPLLEAPVATMDGAKVRLREVAGEVTVLAVWASSCAPCLKELPYLEALHRSYQGEPNVRIIAVGLDKPEKAQQLVREMGLSLPVYLDRGFRVMGALTGATPDGGSFSLPLTAYVDPQGRVFRAFGFDSRQSVEEYVASRRSFILRAQQGVLTEAELQLRP